MPIVRASRRPRRRVSTLFAGIVVTAAALVCLGASPASAAVSDLPEDSTISIPEVTYPNSRYVTFGKSTSTYYLAEGNVTHRGTPGLHRVVLDKTTPDGTVEDHCSPRPSQNADRFRCGAELVGAVEGLYTFSAYHTIDDAARSAAAPQQDRVWIDDTAPAAPITDVPDGFVTTDNMFELTGTLELPPELQLADGDRTEVVYTIYGPDGYQSPAMSTSGTDRNDLWSTIGPRVDGGMGGGQGVYANGDYSVEYYAHDRAGNRSEVQTFNFTVNAPVPAPPVIQAPTEGASLTDATPTISGTGMEGATIAILEGGTTLCTTTAVGAVWSCDASSLSLGAHTIVASQSDAATGTLLESAPVTFQISDAAAIAPVVIDSPSAGAETGERPIFTGTGEPGATVTLTRHDVVIGTAIVADGSRWSLVPSADLAVGAATVTATQDVDGSETSVSFIVTASTPPVVPGDGGSKGEAAAGLLATTGTDAALILPVVAGAFIVIALGMLLLMKRARRIEVG